MCLENPLRISFYLSIWFFVCFFFFYVSHLLSQFSPRNSCFYVFVHWFTYTDTALDFVLELELELALEHERVHEPPKKLKISYQIKFLYKVHSVRA